MTKIYPPLLPEIRDWPLYKLYEDRDGLIETVDQQTLDYILEKHGDRIGDLISRVCYLELIRLKDNPWKVDPPNEAQFWKRVRSEVTANDKLKQDLKLQNNTEILRRIIHRYTSEIAGNFKESTFLFARKFLTLFFKRLLNAAAGKNYRKLWRTKLELYERIKIHGDVDLVRSMFNHGTVVILPTHLSNLDSILIGYALDAVVGLPAFAYGAGLNLYESEIFAYYMTRLGAYRVDRRKKNPIYLDSLKIMSQVMLERGTNSLFFPGGTRSRSGEIERELKYGLLNSLLSAQRSIYEHNGNQKIIVVPLILGYHCTLEAQSLISSHLKATGEEKYVGSGRKSFKIRNILTFAWKFFSQASEIHLSFGEPMDVLGYKLDVNGQSIDERQHPVDIKEFFSLHGKIEANRQRESVYTRKLAEKVVENYEKYYVVLTSHLAAYTAFEILRKIYPAMDLYAVLRLPVDMLSIPMPLFKKTFSNLLEVLIKMEQENKIRLQDELHALSLDDMIKNGVRYLGSFHAVWPLKFGTKDNIIAKNPMLVYYYHNRLSGYGLEELISWDMESVHQAQEHLHESE
ncbi:MAG: 1-acyl-sn-glycerol-3-phosphate acyltransferase [Saprospiraceae bacterium]|nr:1-acyl-sn-glycerol-3-phosphate acyltransferase [Saprospiraceae bacterium]